MKTVPKDFIDPATIQHFVDVRLQAMQERPGMWGTTKELESESYLLLEIAERFGRAEPRDLRERYQILKRKLYKKCPGPFSLSHWLLDKENGFGMEEHLAQQTIMDFFIELRDDLKKY